MSITKCQILVLRGYKLKVISEWQTVKQRTRTKSCMYVTILQWWR